MTDEQKDITNIAFLALVLWREARGESLEVKEAIAASIMYRVKNPRWWGKTLLEILFKPYQYSSMTDPKDQQLTFWPKMDKEWGNCVGTAMDAIEGHIEELEADSYHDTSISPPYWVVAPSTQFVKQVGAIKFYNTIKHEEVMPNADKKDGRVV